MNVTKLNIEEIHKKFRDMGCEQLFTPHVPELFVNFFDVKFCYIHVADFIPMLMNFEIQWESDGTL